MSTIYTGIVDWGCGGTGIGGGRLVQYGAGSGEVTVARRKFEIGSWKRE
jgi:hypothetical protein